jgi:serine/threonine protein kinase
MPSEKEPQPTIIKPQPTSENNIHDQKTVLINRTKATSQPNVDNENDVITIRPGTTLNNRFDILEIIGSGGMGTVYKALDKRDIEAGNSCFIAIKVLNNESKNSATLLKALYEETKKTQSLSHPNIVTVYDFDRDSNLVYMTMELIEGAPLDQVLKRNPSGINYSEAIDIIIQIANALSYAHNKHIIHLDLKPNNIYFDRNKIVKILDFGIAQKLNSSLSNNDETYIPIAITPNYASIELLNDENPSGRDDIYAFACVCYEVLTGKHPYNRERADLALEKNLTPTKIKSLNNQQWKALKKALALRKDDRTQSIEQFLLEFKTKKNNTHYFIVGGLIALLLPFIYFQFLNTPEEIKPIPVQAKTPPPSANQPVSTPPLINQPTDKTPSEKPANKISQRPIIPIEKTIEKQQGKINISTDKKNYQVGDTLTMSFDVDRPLYVQIFLINSAGEETLLFPNPYQLDNHLKPNKTYQIPPKGADFTLDLKPPTGEDKIISLASSKPFLSDSLEKNEPSELFIQFQTTYLIH